MLPFIALGILVSLAGVATFGLEETSGKALEDTLHSAIRETNEKGHLLQKGKSREACAIGKGLFTDSAIFKNEKTLANK